MAIKTLKQVEINTAVQQNDSSVAIFPALRDSQMHLARTNNNLSNHACISGVVTESPCFHHSSHGTSIFRFFLEVKRLSGVCDTIPVFCPSSFFEAAALECGNTVQVTGSIRTEKAVTEPVYKPASFAVFADAVVPANSINDNIAMVKGYLCKTPTIRYTMRGKAALDVVLAIPRNNRYNNKADYVPCIMWGTMAHFVSNFEKGDVVAFHGRIQSRQYKKVIEKTGELESRTTYEVAVYRIVP